MCSPVCAEQGKRKSTNIAIAHILNADILDEKWTKMTRISLATQAVLLPSLLVVKPLDICVHLLCLCMLLRDKCPMLTIV